MNSQTQFVEAASWTAATHFLKDATDGARTTSVGKLFHKVTVTGKKINRYASTLADGRRNLMLWPQVSRVFNCKLGWTGMATSSWTIVTLDRSLRSSRDSQPRYSRIDDVYDFYRSRELPLNNSLRVVDLDNKDWNPGFEKPGARGNLDILPNPKIGFEQSVKLAGFGFAFLHQERCAWSIIPRAVERLIFLIALIARLIILIAR